MQIVEFITIIDIQYIANFFFFLYILQNIDINIGVFSGLFFVYEELHLLLFFIFYFKRLHLINPLVKK